MYSISLFHRGVLFSPLRKLLFCCMCWVVLCFVSSPVHGEEINFPTIVDPVHDNINILGSGEGDRLSKKLVALRDKHGVHMAVLIIRTTEPLPIEDYSHQVAEKWGGGVKGEDRGILFVLAIDDRRMRLEVGLGLEEVIPDTYAKRAIESIKSDLQIENYDGAIEKIIDFVFMYTDHLEPGAEITRSWKLNWKLLREKVLLFLFVLALVFHIVVGHVLVEPESRLKKWGIFVTKAILFVYCLLVFLDQDRADDKSVVIGVTSGALWLVYLLGGQRLIGHVPQKTALQSGALLVVVGALVFFLSSQNSTYIASHFYCLCICYRVLYMGMESCPQSKEKEGATIIVVWYHIVLFI